MKIFLRSDLSTLFFPRRFATVSAGSYAATAESSPSREIQKHEQSERS
jgi:hypothetical protein